MTRLMKGSALALCMTASPALADLTAAEVWDGLETYLEGFGYEVTAERSDGDGTLTLSEVTVSMDLPEDGGTVRFDIAEIGLTERDDGSVSMTFPPRMPITVEGLDGTPGDRVVVDYTQDALEVAVSGEPGALVYDYSAQSMGVALVEVVEDGESLGRDAVRFSMTLGPMDGRSDVTRTDTLTSIAQAMTLGDVRFDAAFDDPENETAGTFTGSLTSVIVNGRSDIPPDVDMQDLAAALANGFATDARFQHEGATLSFEVDEPESPGSGRIASDGGHFEIAMDAESLLYDTGAQGTRIAFAAEDIPVPVELSFAETGFRVVVPLAASEVPQPAEFAMTLAGLELSELLWSMADPAGALPREPATVALALEAMVTPFVSLLDPEAMAAVDGAAQMPGELNSVTLADLVIDAVGARLTGGGAFTFDNTDLQTFPGFPRPEGAVDLEVAGANRLIDTLVEMGLLTEEDAGGARLMLSLFTVPTGTPDALRSRIEINEEGHILANGQRIQ